MQQLDKLYLVLIRLCTPALHTQVADEVKDMLLQLSRKSRQNKAKYRDLFVSSI